MLHYNPRHVLSINMPIFRRTNCIITASGIVTLEVGEYCFNDTADLILFHFINIGSITYFQSDDARCCDNTICPPEDGHVDAQNMSRIVM